MFNSLNLYMCFICAHMPVLARLSTVNQISAAWIPVVCPGQTVPQPWLARNMNWCKTDKSHEQLTCLASVTTTLLDRSATTTPVASAAEPPPSLAPGSHCSVLTHRCVTDDEPCLTQSDFFVVAPAFSGRCDVVGAQLGPTTAADGDVEGSTRLRSEYDSEWEGCDLSYKEVSQIQHEQVLWMRMGFYRLLCFFFTLRYATKTQNARTILRLHEIESKKTI